MQDQTVNAERKNYKTELKENNISQNMLTKVKYAFDRLINTFDLDEERIRELDKTVEIIQI